MKIRILFLLLLIFIASCNQTIRNCDNMATRIIDGDTIVLSDGNKVRLIGINAPEKGKPYSKIAASELGNMVLNKCLVLEKDASDKDKYGRLLRYVYADGKFVNEMMIENGFAKAFIYGNDTKYSEKFKLDEESARKNRLGIWE